MEEVCLKLVVLEWSNARMNEQKTETLEGFTGRMSKVEKSEEFQVGRACSGDTRSIFQFEGQWCHLESRGFRTLPKGQAHVATPAQMFYVAMGNPTDWWVHSRLIYGKDRAKRLMRHYGAFGIEEDPYPREEGVWFCLQFRKFEELMRMVWDIHTGAFKELWGDEPKEYESCIGYLGQKNEG
jgi:hypothetical protein